MMNKNCNTSNGNVMVLMLIVLCSIIVMAVIVFGLMFFKYNQSQKERLAEHEAPQDTAYLEYSSMIDQLQEKGDLLTEREKKLGLQSERIQHLERELLVTRGNLEKIQLETQHQFEKLEESERKNLKKLAKMYALMDPAQAAPILTILDDDTIINMLSLMKERNAAKLLGGFSAQNIESQKRAALISEKMRLLTTTTEK